MYVALRELDLGNGNRRLPGQPVPEASKWSEVVLRAQLNLNYIKWVPASKKKKSKNKKA